MKKQTVVLLALAGAVLALYAVNQPWLQIAYSDAGNQGTASLTGASLNAVLTPLVLAALVATIVLLFARGLGVLLLGALNMLLGAVLAFASYQTVAADSSAAAGYLTEITGIAGGDQLDFITGSTTTLNGVLGIAAGVMILLSGVIALFLKRDVKTGSGKSRYERSAGGQSGGASSAAEPDRISDWDALTHDEDPTA